MIPEKFKHTELGEIDSRKFKHTKLGETKTTKNYFQTWRYLHQNPPFLTLGGHWLKNHPQRPSQNTGKSINHPVIFGEGTLWSPRSGNATGHIPNCNWEGFSGPWQSPTSSSSTKKFRCSWSSKVHRESCGPSGSMATNGKCGRYSEAAIFRITGGRWIQGAATVLHQLRQPHTFGNHPVPIWLSWDHITHVQRGELTEGKKRLVAPRPNGWPI